MDIGKQQRVIIVEVDEAVAGEPEPVAEPARTVVLPEPGSAWPLPIDLDADFDFDPVPADVTGSR